MTTDEIALIVTRLKYHVSSVEQCDEDAFNIYVSSNARLGGKVPFKRFAEVGLLFLGYGWDTNKGHYFRVLEIKE